MILRLALLGVCLSTTAMAQHAGTYETTDVPGEYRFDTGVLKGTIGEGGVSLGLVPMTFGPEKRPLAKTPGILNYYRVFTTNKRWGNAMRDVPSQTELLAPDTLRVHWPAAEDRPFELTATYQWRAADTLDVRTSVTAHADLPDFEVFLSSYFTEQFPTPAVYAISPEGPPAFLTAAESDGFWQMFPRDETAVGLIQDGRWTIEPHPVDWTIRPKLAAPISLRRAEDGLTCVLMTRPQDCFALSTPFEGEGHYSLYQSLFGGTLTSGDKVEAVVRLSVGNFTDEEVLQQYKNFMNE